MVYFPFTMQFFSSYLFPKLYQNLGSWNGPRGGCYWILGASPWEKWSPAPTSCKVLTVEKEVKFPSGLFVCLNSTTKSRQPNTSLLTGIFVWVAPLSSRCHLHFQRNVATPLFYLASVGHQILFTFYPEYLQLLPPSHHLLCPMRVC